MACTYTDTFLANELKDLMGFWLGKFCNEKKIQFWFDRCDFVKKITEYELRPRNEFFLA